MSCIRNKNWSEDDDLKADLTRYVREGLSRSEILDFVSRLYYLWMEHSHALEKTEMREYQIFYNEKTLSCTVDDVRSAWIIRNRRPTFPSLYGGRGKYS